MSIREGKPIAPTTHGIDGVVGTAEETSRFFQLLLDEGRYGDRNILSTRQVQRATSEQVLASADLTLFLTPQRYGPC